MFYNQTEFSLVRYHDRMLYDQTNLVLCSRDTYHDICVVTLKVITKYFMIKLSLVLFSHDTFEIWREMSYIIW